jgi:hypothetical protein
MWLERRERRGAGARRASAAQQQAPLAPLSPVVGEVGPVSHTLYPGTPPPPNSSTPAAALTSSRRSAARRRTPRARRGRPGQPPAARTLEPAPADGWTHASGSGFGLAGLSAGGGGCEQARPLAARPDAVSANQPASRQLRAPYRGHGAVPRASQHERPSSPKLPPPTQHAAPNTLPFTHAPTHPHLVVVVPAGGRDGGADAELVRPPLGGQPPAGCSSTLDAVRQTQRAAAASGRCYAGGARSSAGAGRPAHARRGRSVATDRNRVPPARAAGDAATVSKTVQRLTLARGAALLSARPPPLPPRPSAGARPSGASLLARGPGARCWRWAPQPRSRRRSPAGRVRRRAK